MHLAPKAATYYKLGAFIIGGVSCRLILFFRFLSSLHEFFLKILSLDLVIVILAYR